MGIGDENIVEAFTNEEDAQKRKSDIYIEAEELGHQDSQVNIYLCQVRNDSTIVHVLEIRKSREFELKYFLVSSNYSELKNIGYSLHSDKWDIAFKEIPIQTSYIRREV